MAWDYYTRQFEKFSFRDTGGIRIPKGVRELNYQMSVDIVIETITAEKYSSDYTYPDKTHYGFATLVFQDCASLEIPVHQARQRIYEGRVEDAFVQWSNLINIALFHCAWYKHLLLAIEKGNVEEYPQFSPMHTEWKELPLLEVLYRPVYHSQWRFEIEMTQPSSFADCLGFVQNGKSKQQDSPKDSGLPPDGTQPRKNDPNDPFAGNTPPDNALGTPWYDPNSRNGAYNNQDPNNNPKYKIVIKYWLIWCPYPIDPSNPSTSCAPYTPAGEQTREVQGSVYEVQPDDPNPLCPQCNSSKVLVDGNVVVRSALTINSIELLPLA